MKYQNAEMRVERFHDYDFMTDSEVLTDPVPQTSAPANTEQGYGPIH